MSKNKQAGLNVIDIKRRNNEGDWLDYCPGVLVQVRPVTPKLNASFLRQSTKKIWRNHQYVEEIDGEKLAYLVSQYAVAGWSGISEGEKEFQCSPENIQFMMENDSDFSMFIQKSALGLGSSMAEVEEAEIKN